MLAFLIQLLAVLALPVAQQDGKVIFREHFYEHSVVDYLLLPGTSVEPEDETIIIWTTDGSVHVSHDQGTNWITDTSVSNVVNVFKSDTKHNQLYAFSSEDLDDNFVYVSFDRARTFTQLRLPAKPSIVFSVIPHVVTFHPNHPDWLMFTGTSDCDRPLECPGTAYWSKDRGSTWQKLKDDVVACQWITGLANEGDEENLVYCYTAEPRHKGGNLKVEYSTDYFKTSGDLEGMSNVANIVLDQPFAIAGYLDTNRRLHAAISRDGVHYEQLKYPPNIQSESGALVVIQSDDNSVMLYEGTNGNFKENQFGSLLRSGGYGTNFVSILDNVNRASGVYDSYVDIDRIASVEGVLIANVVLNADEVSKVDGRKQLGTYISHSNGARWMRLPAPAEVCRELGEGACFLNFHGHSERLDKRNTPSSPSAVGMFLARGNIGAELGDLANSATWMTRDAGMTWRQVSDRPMFWEFGDSGSIVILVDSLQPTNKVLFTVDEGDTWQEFQFSDTLVKVINLVTIPSDTSRKFNIIARPPVSSGSAAVSIQVDFSNAVTRQCDDADFVWWTPPHPQTSELCMLGHVTKFYRRKPHSLCVVGKTWRDGSNTLPAPPKQEKSNCECTRNDFECDYGYELDLDTEKCKLIEGTSVPNQQSQCADGAIAWHEVTGFRKLAASTCEGGERLDKPELYACPGKEKEFEQQFPGGKAPPSGPPPNPDGPSNEPPPPSPPPPNSPSLPSAAFSAIFKILKIAFLVLFFLVTGVVMYSRRSQIHEIFSRLSGAVNPAFSGAAASIHLPEAPLHSNESVSTRVRHGLVSLFDSLKYGVSKLPFIGSNQPYDHLGFYSRMDDEERMRILESDQDYADSDDDTVGDVYRSEDAAYEDAAYGDDDAADNADENYGGDNFVIGHDSDDEFGALESRPATD